MPLKFDIVICTRNRPAALELSIPLMLSQSRQPERIIVIDSSDDHDPVGKMVARVTKGWDRPIIVEHSVPGLPHQRNLGLKHVTSDVVVFPDDDSLFHPGTSEAILQAYERDTEGRIAGVCATPARTPPPGVLPEAAYTSLSGNQRGKSLNRLRYRIEKALSNVRPALYLGQIFSDRQPWPEWTTEAGLSPVETMTGFRMSFRTDAIRAVGFDPTLSHYGLHEDVDASLSVARNGLLVGANRALIYHHRFPGGRGNPYTKGVISALNRAYIACKHIADGGLTPAQAAGVRKRLKWFMRLQLLEAAPGIRSADGRARLSGLRDGRREGLKLLHVPRANLPAAYKQTEQKLGLWK